MENSPGFACGACLALHPREAFSTTQWEQHIRRKCSDCARKAMELGQRSAREKKCGACSALRPREAFSKTQWCSAEQVRKCTDCTRKAKEMGLEKCAMENKKAMKLEKSAVPVWNRVLEKHSARRNGTRQRITENAPTAQRESGSASRSCAATVRKVCVGVSSRSLHGDARMICREHVSLVQRRSAKKRQRKCAMPAWNRVLERHSARRNGMTRCINEYAPTAFKRSPRSCAAAAEKTWVGLGSRNVHGDIRMICREHVSLVRRSSSDYNKILTQDKKTEIEREGVVVRRGPSHRLDGLALRATCRGRREDGAMFQV